MASRKVGRRNRREKDRSKLPPQAPVQVLLGLLGGDDNGTRLRLRFEGRALGDSSAIVWDDWKLETDPSITAAANSVISVTVEGGFLCLNFEAGTLDGGGEVIVPPYLQAIRGPNGEWLAGYFNINLVVAAP